MKSPIIMGGSRKNREYDPMYPMKQCKAKSKRSGKRCQNWAMHGKNTCRFHGGKSSGPRTREGLEKIKSSNTKHGFYSVENSTELKKMKQLIFSLASREIF